MDFWEQQAADAQQVKAKKVTKKSPHVSSAEKLDGIRGWLAFFVVGQILALALTIFTFFADGFISPSDIATFNEYQDGLGDALQTLTTLEIVAITTYVALIITTLVLLARRRTLAKTFAIISLIYVAVYGVLDYAAVSSIFASSGLSEDVEVRATMRQYGSDVGRNVVVALIWVPYFMVSARVKATLTRTSKGNSESHVRTLYEKGIEKGSYEYQDRTASKWWPKVGIIILIIVVLTGFVAFITGGRSPRLYEKVIQEYQPATYREENTGSYNIKYTERWLCGGGKTIYRASIRT